MKAISILFFVLLWMSSSSQAIKKSQKRYVRKTSTAMQPATGSSTPAQPRQSITEKRLNPTQATGINNTPSSDASPFVSGIHAADGAAKKYDSVAPANPNNINNTVSVAGNNGVIENDTVANANTINQSGVTTNSGAVDKSGQAQFGQTNWGSGRSTIGEGQWTVPPPVSSSFTKDVAAYDNLSWSRSTTDSSVYTARYKAGADWILSSYNSTGNMLDRRTEITLKQLPQTVNTYIEHQTGNFQATSVNRLQVQGKPEVYEIRTNSGRTIYLNTQGVEVNY